MMSIRFVSEKGILLFILLGITACKTIQIRPINYLSSTLAQSVNSYREPILSKQWLVALTYQNGRERIELIDLRRRRKVALPGINRSDSQPISASVSADGQRLVFIRQRADKTELMIYRRNSGALERLDISPKGVPRRVSIDGSGRVIAVQVSRNGNWDIDLIRLRG